MNSQALTEATEKAHRDFVAAAAREDEIRSRLAAAQRVTDMFEDVFLTYQKALLAEKVQEVRGVAA
jgi:hypothetical protein